MYYSSSSPGFCLKTATPAGMKSYYLILLRKKKMRWETDNSVESKVVSEENSDLLFCFTPTTPKSHFSTLEQLFTGMNIVHSSPKSSPGVQLWKTYRTITLCFNFSGVAFMTCFFISTRYFRNCYCQLMAPALSLSASCFFSPCGREEKTLSLCLYINHPFVHNPGMSYPSN